MPISALADRPVLLLGGGREGRATLEWLQQHRHRAPLHLLGDQPPDPPLAGAPWVSAADLGPLLTPATVVIRSPGFAPAHPLRRLLDASPVEQTTATRLALAELRAAGLPLIGVTASKGKSTISSLTDLLLQAAGHASELAGNIGVPLLARVEAMIAAAAPVVIELSSYQCDDLMPGEGPQQVVFGTLFPEHLDWHGSLSAYYAAKARLLAAAPAGAHLHVDWRARTVLEQHGLAAVLARHDVSLEWVNRPAGLHVAGHGFADGSRCLLEHADCRMPGLHNRENACLAFAAARRHGALPAHLAQVLRDFGGLPFRLQDEGRHGGIRWINDSISTAPEAACAGLEALQGSVSVLIAGGQDRGYDYAPLAAAMVRWQVRHLVALPESGPAIAAALKASSAVHAAGAPPLVSVAANLAEAVARARQLAPPGSTCLFSPAAPSYHAWPGFEARGRDFRTLVLSLA
ncbi:MAG: UDP-N-acetylmuramoyl-L-alanine--D-glutamate ligase [Pseudomonadota bacterium]|nr:UDP-N-acetylmuramoyl-L-alanine--D-glutamate ligase [Pseudomonadota bacterium]